MNSPVGLTLRSTAGEMPAAVAKIDNHRVMPKMGSDFTSQIPRARIVADPWQLRARSKIFRKKSETLARSHRLIFRTEKQAYENKMQIVYQLLHCAGLDCVTRNGGARQEIAYNHQDQSA